MGGVMGMMQSVPQLAEQLKNGSDEKRANVADTIVSISGSQSVKRDLFVQAGCVPPLVEMLSSPLARGRERAAAALGHLALSAANKAKIAEAGAIKKIVELTKDESVACRSAAATALSSLASKSPENQASIAKVGGIAALVKLVNDEKLNPMARTWAAAALGNLAVLPSTHAEIVKCKGIDSLVQLLVFLMPHGVVAPSVWERFGIHCRRRKAAGDIDGEWVDKGKEWVTKALSALAYNSPSNQALIGDAGAISPLIQLVRIGAVSGRYEATKAIGNLISGCDANKDRVVEAGGVPVFLNQLDVKSAPDQIKDLSAGLVGSVAGRSRDTQVAVAATGAIPRLIWFLHAGSPTGRAHAALALGKLAEGMPENQTQIGEAGGVVALVRLAQVSLAQLRRSVARAICCVVEGHEENLRRMADAGGLELKEYQDIASISGMRLSVVEDSDPASAAGPAGAK
eukprot:TRINITY_DN19184_c0_g1_i1.p1 TRINITY_DN19184_c0_g1~~TRINITY_DN19184_c0_g1_i1.p1  ORF type:complete len:474 (-),score=89.72 TRINITY_DN19184_c0_g1_i1:3-1373(-)